MATRVLYNCDARVMDRQDSRAEALAYRDGVLVAVGARAEVERVAGDGAESWDAGGATVLPGFIDAHHHPCISSLYGGVAKLAGAGVSNIPSLSRVLSRAAEGLGPGEWLVATDWDELLLDERRPPTRAELDAAVPDRPLFALHYGCHRALGNSRALELAGIGKATPDPAGGFISRGAGGLPDGLLLERAMSPVEALARSSLIARDAEGFLARLARHHEGMVRAGITRVADAAVPADLAALYQEAAKRELLLVPTLMLPVSTTGYLDEPWEILDAAPAERGEGLLMHGPVKLIFDGAPACAMCLGWWQTASVMLSSMRMSLQQRSFDVMRNAMSLEPRFGRKIETGIQIYRHEQARKIVRTATERGFGLAIHAIGNAAVDVALGAYDSVGGALGKTGVPRLEHAIFIDRELCKRIAGVGAAVVTQPHFLSLPAFGAAPPIPGLGLSPLRWLLDAGVELAGSSDFPVAGFAPLDGVRSAVTRKTARGAVLDEDQCLGLHEALGLYTRGAAVATGCLDRCGTLEPGKRADLVVLDAPLTGPSALERARVRATLIGGRVVFGNPVASA